MFVSSLMPDDEPRGSNDDAGGGVLAPLESEKVSQNCLPFEFFIACCLKLLDSPAPNSAIASSTGISSMASWMPLKLGDE
jgi:hypothetical protein